MFNWKPAISRILEAIGLVAQNDSANQTEGGTMSSLPPAELKRLVINAANDRAMSWDECLDFPNVFEVRISNEDWCNYYGSRLCAVERRLEEAVEQFADDIGAVLDPPTVTLVTDGSLKAGEAKADAYFADPSSELVTPRMFVNGTDPEPDVVNNRRAPELETARHDHPLYVTPAKLSGSQTATALLVAEDGILYSLKDDTTVGIVRNAERDMPDVELPYTVGMQFCSQIHAVFKHRGGEWAVENLGKNGICINDKNWIVGEGATEKLCDNDTIRFGESIADAFVFHAVAKKDAEEHHV